MEISSTNGKSVVKRVWEGGIEKFRLSMGDTSAMDGGLLDQDNDQCLGFHRRKMDIESEEMVFC